MRGWQGESTTFSPFPSSRFLVLLPLCRSDGGCIIPTLFPQSRCAIYSKGFTTYRLSSIFLEGHPHNEEQGGLALITIDLQVC